MTFYMHKASGTSPSGQFWSFGLKSTSGLSEAAAQTSWNARVSAFFATAGVAALYKTTTILTATSTSTASPTWHQTTKTSNVVSVPGTATTQELPEQVAMVYSLFTAQANKGGRGRIFLPGPVAAALTPNTGGELLAANATTIAAALLVFRNGLVTDGVQPVIVNLKATRSSPVAFTPKNVTGGKLDTILHTQRRRGDKRVPIYTAA
jgi:hypothetical protein